MITISTVEQKLNDLRRSNNQRAEQILSLEQRVLASLYGWMIYAKRSEVSLDEVSEMDQGLKILEILEGNNNG